MIDPDTFKSGQIETKLKLKQFVLIKNVKGNCDVWSRKIFRWLEELMRMVWRRFFGGFGSILSVFFFWLLKENPSWYNLSLLAIIAFQHIELIANKINQVNEKIMDWNCILCITVMWNSNHWLWNYILLFLFFPLIIIWLNTNNKMIVMNQQLKDL